MSASVVPTVGVPLGSTVSSGLPSLELKKALTPQDLRRLFAGGAVQLMKHTAHLNKINVFPVPDGDTGVNMSGAMRFMIRGIEGPDDKFKTISSVWTAIVTQCIMGARGNSGTILTFFFSELRNSLTSSSENDELLTLAAFREALRSVAANSHNACADPVEVILSLWLKFKIVSKS